MSDVDPLLNPGTLVLNSQDPGPEQKTVVVLGVARGGTTMVASVLSSLGIYMGERLGPVMEDATLSEAVEKGWRRDLPRIVAERDARHDVWGWKRPSAFKYRKVWEAEFRNPHVIAIYRDPFAIANRNRISMMKEVWSGLDAAIHDLGKLTRCVRALRCPVMLCSYEKALQAPGRFVEEVDRFLDLNAESRWEAAVAAMTPDKRYLQSSRINRTTGFLENLDATSFSGWASFAHFPRRQARVKLLVNGEERGQAVAAEYRSDLKASGKHPTGECGFSGQWSGPTPGMDDEVQAWVEGDVVPLPISAGLAARLREATPKRPLGYVDRVTRKECAGWAVSGTQPDESAEISIRLNGREVVRTRADEYREDVVAAGKHATGVCGFRHYWGEGSPVPDAGDRVEVRVAGEPRPLGGVRRVSE